MRYRERDPSRPVDIDNTVIVDPPETPFAQAEDDSSTLSRRTGQEPPACSRNRQKKSGAAATTVPGECVPTSGLGLKQDK